MGDTFKHGENVVVIDGARCDVAYPGWIEERQLEAHGKSCLYLCRKYRLPIPLHELKEWGMKIMKVSEPELEVR